MTENGPLGILVTTAVEVTVQGKALKPAGVCVVGSGVGVGFISKYLPIALKVKFFRLLLGFC